MLGSLIGPVLMFGEEGDCICMCVYVFFVLVLTGIQDSIASAWTMIASAVLVFMTSRASVAQLVRARDCQSLGRRFDSG